MSSSQYHGIFIAFFRVLVRLISGLLLDIVIQLKIDLSNLLMLVAAPCVNSFKIESFYNVCNSEMFERSSFLQVKQIEIPLISPYAILSTPNQHI